MICKLINQMKIFNIVNKSSKINHLSYASRNYT